MKMIILNMNRKRENEFSKNIPTDDYKFSETEWDLIYDYQSTNTDKGSSALNELTQKYWKPLYYYLRRIGFKPYEAEDLIQGFFTEKVFEQKLFEKACRKKGKLRTFLLVALKNYAFDIQRSNSFRILW